MMTCTAHTSDTSWRCSLGVLDSSALNLGNTFKALAGIRSQVSGSVGRIRGLLLFQFAKFYGGGGGTGAAIAIPGTLVD